MTASAVSFRAWIAARLLIFGHGSDLHEPFQSFAEDAALLAGGFVHAFDGFTPPVGPVEVSAQLCQSERMSGPLDQLDAESATQIGRFNAIQLSIGPVKPMAVVINGQSVGPTQFRRNNGRTSRSIQE